MLSHRSVMFSFVSRLCGFRNYIISSTPYKKDNFMKSHCYSNVRLFISSVFILKIESLNWPDWYPLFSSPSCSSYGMPAMLEISSSFSQSMVQFSTGDLSAEHLASLGAQSLDPILASASRQPPSPSVPPKGMNGEHLIVQWTQLWFYLRLNL